MFKVLIHHNGRLASPMCNHPYTPHQPTPYRPRTASRIYRNTTTGYHLFHHAHDALAYAAAENVSLAANTTSLVFHAHGFGNPIHDRFNWDARGLTATTAVFTSVTVTTPYTGNA